MKVQLIAAAVGGCLLTGCIGLQPKVTLGTEPLQQHRWTGRILVFGTAGYVESLGYKAAIRPAQSVGLIDKLEYREWKGRKAEIEGMTAFKFDVNGGAYKFLRLKALDSGQYIYMPWDLGSSPDTEIYNMPEGLYFEDEIQKLRPLEGTTIWANGALLEKLWTTDVQLTMPIAHAEALRVVQITTATYPHVDSKGTFLIIVKNPQGKTGFFPFQEQAFFNQNPIKSGWAKEVIKCVRARNVCMGMPAEALVASWGKADAINRTVTAANSSEQWVYGGTYVYLTNGRVDSWQDSSR